MSNSATYLRWGIVTVLIAGGFAGGYWLGHAPSDAPASEPSSAARKPLYYRNPMNPSVTSPVPAKDAMGMDYIPVYADDVETDETPGTVRIDPVTEQNIGVRTAKAERKRIGHIVRANGRVTENEERIVRLHPKIEGWVDEMFVDETGEQVVADQPLLALYSPLLVASQEEYVLAIKNQRALAKSPIEEIRNDAAKLVASARERLKLFDVPEHQIRELEQTLKPKRALHVHAPISGVVMHIGVRVGQHVDPKTELYEIADLSKVWVYADVFDYELPWIQVGDGVEVTVASVPGRVFKGTLDYIYPYAQSQTRTVKVRSVFDNPDLLLKPETFVDVTIRTTTEEDAVVIPLEAVVRSGAEDRVFVVTGPGRFEPRTVRLGVQGDDEVAVLSGLQAGEEVVTSAQFLIDSESSLREAAAKMRAPNAGATHEKGTAPSPDDAMDMEHTP